MAKKGLGGSTTLRSQIACALSTSPLFFQEIDPCCPDGCPANQHNSRKAVNQVIPFKTWSDPDAYDISTGREQ